MEERGIIGLPQRRSEHNERILAAGQINIKIDSERTAHGPLCQARSQSDVAVG